MLHSKWVLLGPLEAFEVGGIALISQAEGELQSGSIAPGLPDLRPVPRVWPTSHHAFSCHPKVFVELNELLLDKNQEPQWPGRRRAGSNSEEDVEEETERWGSPRGLPVVPQPLLELRGPWPTVTHAHLSLTPGIAFARARSLRTKTVPHILSRATGCVMSPEPRREHLLS